MPPSFNLIDEPFLPCLRSDGAASEYGLRDVLICAHEVAELRDGSPLVTVALHRLLLAVLHRVYEGPAKQSARVAILTAGRFDAARVSAYLEKWRGRFDLFDEKEPFYQSAGFKTAQPSPVSRLAQELSSANNAALFDHSVDASPPNFSPANAARLLVAHQSYALGGGKSVKGYPNLTDAPLVAGATVLVRGETLFETLCFNLTTYDGLTKPVPCPLNGDRPIWESPRGKRLHEQSGEPHGYLDYLTWQTRTVRLHPTEVEGQVVVRHLSYAQGRAFATSSNFFDPMRAYRSDKKWGIVPVRFVAHKALWRDTAALFQFAEAGREIKEIRRPLTLQTLASLGSDILSQFNHHSLSAYGLCNKKAEAIYWRNETLPLPLKYLEDEAAVGLLRTALVISEDVANKALRVAARAVASEILSNHEGSSPDKDRVSKLIDALAPERRYWCDLEREFRKYMVEFASGKKSLSDWYFEVVRPAALRAYESTFGQLKRKWDGKPVTRNHTRLKGLLRRTQRTHHIEDLTAKKGAV